MAAPASEPARDRPPSQGGGMAGPAVACYAAAAGLLFLLLPHGFVAFGQRLDTIAELALLGGAVAAGAWGAFSARDRRAGLGAVVAFLLLAPAYDPRGPLERLPGYVAAGALLLLGLEFALLHARMARIAALPRAHVTQGSRARETELRETAGRIAGAWPPALLVAAGVVAAALAVSFGLASLAPATLGRSVEMQGPFGLVLGAALVLVPVAFVASRRLRETAHDASPPGAAPHGEGGPRSTPDGGAGTSAGGASPPGR